MGLTRNYLRYVREATFGVVAASQAGSAVEFLQMRGTKDRFIVVPANEDVLFWDLKTREIINRLKYEDDNAAEVSVIKCYHGSSARTKLIAVGYANGKVKVFEYETGSLKLSLTGHRTSISALTFDRDGSRLASGGKDCNIVVWDLVSEKGLFTLKGHKNLVTNLEFLHNDEYQRDLIVSSSVDPTTSIKFWDLQTQHCFCTLPGQTGGVWSFAILKGGTQLVVGASSPELQVYSIKFFNNDQQYTNREELENIEDDVQGSSEFEFGLKIDHQGRILRNTTATSSRVENIVVDQEESLMICHSTDKILELYSLRSPEEALSYAKKSAKKAARKQAKRKHPTDSLEGSDDETIACNKLQTNIVSLSDLDSQAIVDCEFNKKLGCQKLSHKIKAVALTRVAAKDGFKKYKLAVMQSNNRLESFSLDTDSDKKDEMLNCLGRIENFSHRSDVRAISISADNTLIMSASSESVKIWQLGSRICTTTIDTEYATCCVFANAQNISGLYENRFGFVGTKQGNIQIIDIAEAAVIETLRVCDGKPLNCIYLLPNKTGLVAGGEDCLLNFYNFVWKSTDDDDGQVGTYLSLEKDREFSFNEGITCLNISPNGNLLAVALLDSTVRVHFVDTFKYFLTMYGHKFPVTAMDISSDNTLLITGSPDKNIKIWGLDFGDCHKSIFAHDDVISGVKFVPKTHYAFSCGRDKTIKQWDCDHFIKIQTLRKHQAEIWCLSVSPNGKFVATGSHDKSIRLYRKTEEILVPNEEEETEREVEDERNVFEKQENIIVGEVNLETGFANKMTIDTVKSTDRLIEAIDVFEEEQEKERDWMKQCEVANTKGEPRPAVPEPHPLLMTTSSSDYHRFMLEVLRRVKPSDLEEILITLPFDYVRKLLIILVIFLERRWDVELTVRCAVFLLKINFSQIASSPALVPVVCKLKEIVIDRASFLRDCSGFNLMALEHLSMNRKHLSTRMPAIERGSSSFRL